MVLISCSKLPDDQLMMKGMDYEDREMFGEAIACYEKIDKMYPNSTYRAQALYKAGIAYTYGLTDYDKAIDVFKKTVTLYPDSSVGAQSQFMIGFIYANNASDSLKARLAYTAFLEKYPDHELVPSVEWELEHLGKDINEIFDAKEPEK